MYNEKIEGLIKAALADGELTEKEKQILFRRAQEQGIDLDEFEMVLDARLVELEKAEQKSAPKSDKFGDVRKCPACGAIISSGMAMCKECGFAFSGVGALASREKLYDALQKVDNDQTDNTQLKGFGSMFESSDEKQYKINKQKATRKAMIITSFPVPNAKADLLDFLSYLMSQANPNARKDYMKSVYRTNTTEDLGYAYWVLFESCIARAKVSFRKDADFELFYQKYEELQKKPSGPLGLLGKLFGK